MSKLSPAPLKKKKTEATLNDLWDAIASIESRKEIETFFYDLLTHTERKMLAKRFQIAVMLFEGYDYAAIRGSLQVTDGTIAKVNNWLKTGATGLTEAARGVAKQRTSQFDEKERGGGKYMAGDLLLPAIDAISLAVRKKRKEKSIS